MLREGDTERYTEEKAGDADKSGTGVEGRTGNVGYGAVEGSAGNLTDVIGFEVEGVSYEIEGVEVGPYWTWKPQGY